MGKRKRKNKKTTINYKVETKPKECIVQKSVQTFGSSSNQMKTVTIVTKKPYVYKGTKNKTEFPKFIEICKMTQRELIDILPAELVDAGYTDVVISDGYIYAKGNLPILLTAHMDTVHKKQVVDFYEYVNDKGDHIISSPQGIGGDDRCGIYMILEIIKDFKPSILFCEDEEIGGIGSGKFCQTEFIDDLANLNYLIELDRANAKDAVFYDCDNPEFTEFITTNTGHKEAWGTFSDISNLAPSCGIAAVNLSCGYYHAHTLEEEVNVEEMLDTIEVVKKLLATESEQFEYIEAKFSYGYYYGKSWDWENYTYDSSRYNFGKNNNANTSSIPTRQKTYDYYDEDVENYILFVTYYKDHVTYEEVTEQYLGKTKEHAWFKFFQDNPNTCWNDVLDFDYDYYY